MSASQAQPVRILIVDDEPSLVQALAGEVRSQGWECLTAASIREALDAAESGCPAVAAVGYGLPDGNGNDLIRDLRRRNPGILCILMTGHPDLANAMGAVSARAFAYLVKPFPPVQLNALVHSALEARRLREDYQEEIIRAAEMHAILEAVRVMQDRINNPLQGIMGNAELIQMMSPTIPERCRHLLDSMIKGCDQMGNIVHRLAQALTDQATRREAGQPPDLGAMLRLLDAVGDEAGGGLPSPGQIPEGPLPADDRRGNPRYACSNLMLSVPVAGTTRWTFVDNISIGGLGVRLVTLESLPERFEARLWDLESREADPVEVEMCWSREDNPAPIGLRFVSKDPHVSEWLDDILARIRERSEARATGGTPDGGP